MPTYIAMLRGINVSGHNLIKMEQLRASFAALGFRAVRTYVQSGNVVFAANEPAAGLAAKIEQRIQRDFGFDVPVLVKTDRELAGVVKRNPFVSDTAIDQAKLHVTFLSSTPPATALKQLQPLATGAEQVRVVGCEIYLYCPDGYGRTKFTNTVIEKKLACRATTRNWNTTKTLLEMATVEELRSKEQGARSKE